MVYAGIHIFSIDTIREFCNESVADNLCKTNGAQMATFAATGTKANIDDLRKAMAALGTRLRGIILLNS